MNDFIPKISPQDAMLQSKVDELKRKAKNPAELKKAADQFESLFIYYMLKTMRKTVPKSGLLGSGLGGEIMESLFDQKLSEQAATESRLGIAELIYQQLSGEAAGESAPAGELKSIPLKRSPEKLKKFDSFIRQRIQQNLKPYEKHIMKAARETGVDPDLIRAVIMAESSGNPQAVSAKNARGLMQLMDSTAVEVGVSDPLDPEQNILGGARYLSRLLSRFGGNPELALAAYNAGPGTVEKHKGIPPYKETRRYVRKVNELYHRIKKNHL